MLIRPLIARFEELAAKRDDASKCIEPATACGHLAFDDAGEDMGFAELARLAKSHLAASGRFYTPPPGDDPRFRFDRGVLSFRSPVRTETVSNNTVSVRVYGLGASPSAVVILPHWNAPADSYRKLCRILACVGFTAAELTPPYHGSRSRPESALADYFVSPNLGRTIRSARQAVLDTRRTLDWLELQGCRKFALVGVSMGSCIAALAAAHDARVQASALILTAGDYAEVVWTSRATQHIRKSLDETLRLEELRDIWAIISSGSFVKALARRDHRTLILSGALDRIARPDLTERLCRQLESHRADYIWRRLGCGHFTMAAFPFNVTVLAALLRFLRPAMAANRGRTFAIDPKRLLDVAAYPET